jgi:hypothetical protein
MGGTQLGCSDYKQRTAKKRTKRECRIPIWLMGALPQSFVTRFN